MTADQVNRRIEFDAASNLLRITAAFLHGKQAPRLARPPAPVQAPLGRVTRLLPWLLRQRVLSAPGSSGPNVERILEDDAEAMAQSMADLYPKRRYPAIALGSANGALVHLCAALGIPWLPQDVLVAVNQPPRLPESEPGRPMVRMVSHIRVTLRGLGQAYRAFLTRCLAAGGSILVVDRMGERKPDGDGPMDPAMLQDLLDFARRRGAAAVRVAFNDAQDLSPLVADLYSWWYRRRGIVARRMLATSLIVSDPLWTFRVGAVPYWLEFITELSAASLQRYLEMRPPFDYINLCLFREEAPTADPASLERWQAILAHARRRGEFVGVDAASYPADISSFSRYQAAIRRISARYPIPPPLSLDAFGGFLRYAPRYHAVVEPLGEKVKWLA